MRRPCSSLVLLSLLLATSASAAGYSWTTIGNPGNACDPQPDGDGGTGCYGTVDYSYAIGTYEVTNEQYAEFLNSKAASDPLGLYNENMANPRTEQWGHGGITRTGSDGSYTYYAIGWRSQMPVNHVSFYDALRFVDWLHNGQGDGDTETGAYTLVGGTPEPSNGTTVTRNEAARFSLPSEDEWYKAAYFGGTGYFDYPAGSNTQITCAAPSAAANRANCSYLADSGLTSKGSYTGSASPYGTFDQGGNVFEWNEKIISSMYRGLRGGAYFSGYGVLAASYGAGSAIDPWFEGATVGFRVVPEPGRDLVVIVALVGLARCRRARA